MPIGSSSGQVYEDDTSMALGMPLSAPTETAGALKSNSGTTLPDTTNASVRPPQKVYIDTTPKSDTGELPVSNFSPPPGPDPALGQQGIMDKLLGLNGPRYQTWPEKVLRGIKDGILAPGDAAQGNTPMWAMDPETGEVHTSPEAIEGADSLAQLAVLGPAPLASKLADGTLGSFAGVGSKTINKDALYKANEMFLDGAHPDDIWTATGFHRGADNKWRYEILDNEANLNSKVFDNIPGTKGSWTEAGSKDSIALKPKEVEPDGWGSVFDTPVKTAQTLPDVLHHPKLYEAYPDLAKIKVEPTTPYMNEKGWTGMYSEAENKIYLGPGSSEDVFNTLLHEVQHVVQAREGFARGANEAMYYPKELPRAESDFIKARDEVFKKYRAQGLTDSDLILGVNLTRSEMFNRLSKQGARQIEELKQKAPDMYNSFKNIAQSEDLLRETKRKAYEDYLRTAGEVEARNVERRKDFSLLDAILSPPNSTEGIPRSKQIVHGTTDSRY